MKKDSIQGQKCQKSAKLRCRPTFSQRNKTLKNVPLRPEKVSPAQKKPLKEKEIPVINQENLTYFAGKIRMKSLWRFRPVLLAVPKNQLACLLMSTSNPSQNSNTNQSKNQAVMVVKRQSDLDFHPLGHYERNFITALRAMEDFLLKPEHLVGLRATTRRSPSENTLPVKVYWRKDVEAKSREIWGTLEAMEAEKARRRILEEDDKEMVSLFKRLLAFGKKKKSKIDRETWPVRGIRPNQRQQGLSSDSGQVVMTAIGTVSI